MFEVQKFTPDPQKIIWLLPVKRYAGANPRVAIETILILE
jgi:hypothetical protein